MSANTLFLRLEGPLQSWGAHESKFLIRRTGSAPTKSGIIGMFCAALGASRRTATEQWLPELIKMRMGVRIDRPGVRWWDYHTVGAGMQMRIAEGPEKTKPGPILTRREYLCDASFLAVVQGDARLIETLHAAMQKPQATLYLGRKSCPPSRPILERDPEEFPDIESALRSVPWRRRLQGERPPKVLESFIDWTPTPDEPNAPDDALVWYDMPFTFEPPAHGPRFVKQIRLRVANNGDVRVEPKPTQNNTPQPPRPRADYGNKAFKDIREKRLKHDHHVCVFCKLPGTTVQHVTYRHAGGDERLDELRTLCRLCHDAVSMIEYGLGMGIDRIDPCDPRWRDQISKKREEIVRFRSLETRRRRLTPEEVE